MSDDIKQELREIVARTKVRLQKAAKLVGKEIGFVDKNIIAAINKSGDDLDNALQLMISVIQADGKSENMDLAEYERIVIPVSKLNDSNLAVDKITMNSYKTPAAKIKNSAPTLTIEELQQNIENPSITEALINANEEILGEKNEILAADVAFEDDVQEVVGDDLEEFEAGEKSVASDYFDDEDDQNAPEIEADTELSPFALMQLELEEEKAKKRLN